MGEEKQIELDTDWMSALLAIFPLVLLVAFTGIKIWHVFAGKPLATHVPTSRTWILISPLENWFHAIIAGMAFVYLAAWLKGTIRHA
jgi:hypothetical protein